MRSIQGGGGEDEVAALLDQVRGLRATVGAEVARLDSELAAALARIGPRVSSPALGQWRRELRTGQRTGLRFDALWRAACAEAWAIECDGMPGVAADLRALARRIVAKAAGRAA